VRSAAQGSACWVSEGSHNGPKQALRSAQFRGGGWSTTAPLGRGSDPSYLHAPHSLSL